MSDLNPRGPSIDGHPIAVGDVFDAEVGAVAHGGHFVARLGDVVAFTRHALPGELVRLRVTDVRSRFVRADAIEVLRAHPDRRSPICAVAGVCGGCDFQHATEPLQRRLKSDVMHEALVRHGRLEGRRVDSLLAEGVIDLGLATGWRSRMNYRVNKDAQGREAVGLLQHRSDEWVDGTSCMIANPDGHRLAVGRARGLEPGSRVLMASGVDGPVVAVDGACDVNVRQRLTVNGVPLEFTMPIDGFWQVHPALAQALVDRLIDVATPMPGESWWDLYAGAGPLAGALGVCVGSTGRVDAVESSLIAVRRGQQALESLPWVRWHHGDVVRWLAGRVNRPGRRPASRPRSRSPRSLAPTGALRPAPNGVVLDPPRSGAGSPVLRNVSAYRPGIIVVVACDPIALGRDTAILAAQGYEMANLRVWDAFPQTHHMEAMAVFRPTHQIS